MIIGLVGFKNSGKTSISKRYMKIFNPEAQMIGFSNPIYQMLQVLGIKPEEFQDKSIRNLPHPKLGGKSLQEAMNSLGTDWGRGMIHEDLWIDRSMDCVTDPDKIYIADNVRFPNEADAIIARGGALIAIHNPAVDDDGTKPEAYVRYLQEDRCRGTIMNDQALVSLDEAAHALNYWILKFTQS